MFAEQTMILRKAPFGLWAEFVMLFVGTPLLVALVLPPAMMFAALGIMTVIGVLLMSRTNGFSWRHLRQGWQAVDRRVLLPFALATATAAVGLVVAFLPGRFLALPQASLVQWLAIMLLYPFFSALPQELIFRLDVLALDRAVDDAGGRGGVCLGLCHPAKFSFGLCPALGCRADHFYQRAWLFVLVWWRAVICFVMPLFACQSDVRGAKCGR
jgi:hypothetical protein